MRVFFVTETKEFSHRLFLDASRKYVKGFIRLGHDTQIFSSNHALAVASPLQLRALTRLWWKRRAMKLLRRQIELYKPDIVFVNSPKLVDAETIMLMREAASNAFFMGIDGEVRPDSRPGRIDAASKLDLLFTVYGPAGQLALREAGVTCVFLPWSCDPDVEHRYFVSEDWQSDVIFTGKSTHRNTPTDPLREEIVIKLARMKNCVVRGCRNHAFLGGMGYYYAISGAKIGLSINLANDVQLYHSDRLTHYLACGALVLAKRVPDSDRLFQDGVHLRYFDSADDFFDLVTRYLADDVERERIARAGMAWVHQEYHCEKMARYMLDAMETGSYRAPWMKE